jgi:hypothetical protein
MSAGDAAETVATPPILGPDMTAFSTGLRRVWRGDLYQPTTLGFSLVRQEQQSSSPRHSEDCTVQPGLGLDVLTWTGSSATRRPCHPSDVQVFDHDGAVALGDMGCGLVDPIRAPTGLASPQRGDLAVRVTLAMRRQGARLPRPTLPSSLALKRSQSTRFSTAQWVGHVEIPPIREGHHMDDTEVDPDCRSIPSSDGDCWLLYAEANVPGKRILQQSAAGDATPAGFGGRQGTRPPESHSPDQ